MLKGVLLKIPSMSIYPGRSRKPICLGMGSKLALTLGFFLLKYFLNNLRTRWLGCQSLEAFAFRRRRVVASHHHWARSKAYARRERQF